ncbi:MAG TPA: hypothetical protein VMW49_07145 [Candidatus Dormibacteraeota bacterium]|nr:hypothetical protein [Candidatus Dormibacteraeota bacterium]
MSPPWLVIAAVAGLGAGATLALLLPSAVAAPWPVRALRWVARSAPVLSLAAAAGCLPVVLPAGHVSVALWAVAPGLTLGLRADSTGVVLAILVTALAAAVTLGPTGARPTLTPALTAAFGALLVALGGDLLTVYAGLALSDLGLVLGSALPLGRRILLTVALNQATALPWLIGGVLLWSATGSADLAAIPPAAVAPGLALALLAPAGMRLSAGWALETAPARPAGGAPHPTGWWVAVAGVPSALACLLRVLQLVGGHWPAPWVGLVVALGGAALGVGASLTAWRTRGTLGGAVQAVQVSLAAFVLAAFALGSPTATVVGGLLGIGLVLAAATTWPLYTWTRQAGGDPRARRLVPTALLLAGAVPPSFTAGGVVLLLGVTMAAGFPDGLATMLAILAGLAGIPAVLGTLRDAGAGGARRGRGAARRWPPPEAIASGGLLVLAAVVPGAVLRYVVVPLVGASTAAASSLVTPGWLTAAVRGVAWPGGYLCGIAALVLGMWVAARVALGQPAGATRLPGATAGTPPAREAQDPWPLAGVGLAVAGWVTQGRRRAPWAAHTAARALVVYPWWLALAVGAALAWLLVGR